MQSLMVVVLCFLANLDVTTDFGAIYLLCIVMAVCGATQDIATDALVCSLLTEEERGMGNGIQTAGGMFGFCERIARASSANPSSLSGSNHSKPDRSCSCLSGLSPRPKGFAIYA